MSVRRGRLNTTRIVDGMHFEKKGVIQEPSRPFRLATEAWALRLARRHGLSVPEVQKYYRDAKGQEVLLLNRVDGRILSTKHSPENIRCMVTVGKQLKALRGAGSRYGWINMETGCGKYEFWQDFLQDYLDRYGGHLCSRSLFDSDSHARVKDALQQIDSAEVVSSLIHRDIKPTNLKEDGDTVWILDWENAILGDGLYDLAVFGVRYGHGALWEGLVQGYDAADAVRSSKYLLYEIVALIGVIDFSDQYGLGYGTKVRKLYHLVHYI